MKEILYWINTKELNRVLKYNILHAVDMWYDIIVLESFIFFCVI